MTKRWIHGEARELDEQRFCAAARRGWLRETVSDGRPGEQAAEVDRRVQRDADRHADAVAVNMTGSCD